MAPEPQFQKPAPVIPCFIRRAKFQPSLRIAVEDRQYCYLFALLSELACDLERNSSPEGPAAKIIRAAWLNLPDLAYVSGSHRSDIGQRSRMAVKTDGLQTVERLIGTEMTRKLVILQD